MATERLRVILEMVANQYKKEAKSAALATDGITKSGESAGKSMSGLRGRFDDLSKGAKAAAGAAALGAVTATLLDSARAASDLGESVNAVQKTFGDSADVITQFAESASQATGLAASEFNTLATNSGALLQNFGFSASQAALESIKLTQRAADLASVFNTDVPDALGAVQAALRGETEPIRRFGVSLDAASVKAKAVELGLAETTSAVDQNARATAALALIYEQTNQVAGDFAQTSDSLANSQRIAAAEFENAKARLGQGLTPVLAAGTNALASFVTELQRLSGSDAANQAIKVRTAIVEIQDAAGDDKILKFQDALVDVANEAELTTGVVLSLAGAAGLNAEQVGGAADELVAMARAAGVSEPVIAEMESALRGLTPEAAGAAGAVGDLGDETEDAAGSAAKLVQETKNLGTELRKQADPVFRAVSAFKQYQDTLQEVDEDGQRTAEELLDLADATIGAEEALRNLGGGNLERGLDSIAEALGLSRQAVRELLVELGVLDGTRVRVLIEGQVTGVGSVVTGNDIAENLRFENIRNQARAFGGPVASGRSYLVGERGPEFFTPNFSGRITSQPVGGATENVTINLNVTTTPGFSTEVVREMETALSRYRAGVS